MAISKYKQIKPKRKSVKPVPAKNRRAFKKFGKKRVHFRSRKRKFKTKRPVKRRRKTIFPPVVKQPALPLNIDFYNAMEGVYSSYWAGKLISTLQLSGKRKTVARHFYKAAAVLKLSLGSNPLLLLLEILDKIKPTFRLRNYIVRRTIIKEYPIVVLRPRQLILAVH